VSARHDHLRDALQAVLERVVARDAAGAEAAMERALAAFATTPAPGDDERLAPLMATCEAASRGYHAELGTALKDAALKARAGQAYARGATP
jgi:hypothetical protein